jgi:hypothetical protein
MARRIRTAQDLLEESRAGSGSASGPGASGFMADNHKAVFDGGIPAGNRVH